MLKLRTVEQILPKISSNFTCLGLIQSLTTLAQPLEKIQSFRTLENSPTNQTKDYIGQFYRIPPDVRKQLFLYGGVPRTFETHMNTFAESCLMVRKPALDVINCLKAIDYSKPIVKFVLYGKKGTGKSLSLCHVMHYGFEYGFLLFHLPWPKQWMWSYKEVSNSESKEGYIDLNIDAAAWLIHFKNQNEHLLKNPDLKMTEDHIWNKRESTLKEAPLLQLVDHGINRIKFASDCIVVLAEQIKKLSTAGKCKTLVVIDGLNAFFYPETRIKNEKKQMVPPSKLTITEAVMNLTRSDWNNGVVITTVDEIAISEKDQISHLPRYLLGKEGFEHMDPFVPILVSNYTHKEFKSCMDYFRERKWIVPVDGQDEELQFLSVFNPYRLMELCAGL